MTGDAQLAKFHANWRASGLPPDNAAPLAALVEDIESVSEMRKLVDLMMR